MPPDDPTTIAEKLIAHPGHEHCCPVCRRATAETWANLQVIASTVGGMMTDPPPFMRMLLGVGRKRGRGAQVAEPTIAADGTEHSAPTQVLGLSVQDGQAGAVWVPVNDLIHAHPDPEFPDTLAQHAHVGGDAAHSHIVEGVSPDGQGS